MLAKDFEVTLLRRAVDEAWPGMPGDSVADKKDALAGSVGCSRAMLYNYLDPDKSAQIPACTLMRLLLLVTAETRHSIWGIYSNALGVSLERKG